MKSLNLVFGIVAVLIFVACEGPMDPVKDVDNGKRDSDYNMSEYGKFNQLQISESLPETCKEGEVIKSVLVVQEFKGNTPIIESVTMDRNSWLDVKSISGPRVLVEGLCPVSTKNEMTIYINTNLGIGSKSISIISE